MKSSGKNVSGSENQMFSWGLHGRNVQQSRIHTVHAHQCPKNQPLCVPLPHYTAASVPKQETCKATCPPLGWDRAMARARDAWGKPMFQLRCGQLCRSSILSLVGTLAEHRARPLWSVLLTLSMSPRQVPEMKPSPQSPQHRTTGGKYKRALAAKVK